jgi:uncharacterized protein YjdB
MSRRWWFAGLLLAGQIGCSEADPIEVDLQVSEVIVAPDARVLGVGDTMRLTAYPKTADGTVLGSVAIGWVSEDSAIATVTGNGIWARVEARGTGTTRIRATSEGKTGAVTVTVNQASLPVASVSIVLPDSILDIEETVQLEAVVKAADAWSSGRAVLRHARR